MTPQGCLLPHSNKGLQLISTFWLHHLSWRLLWSPSVQFISVTQSCATLCKPMGCSTPLRHQLPELAQTHVHQVADAIQPYHPLLSPSPPAFNLSRIRVFSNESVLPIRGPKWSFSFSISPSYEYSGLISFGIDWLDLLTVPGTLKSLLQHHSSKASILQCSAFFMAQLSHPYMIIGKTIALTRCTFVGKVTWKWSPCRRENWWVTHQLLNVLA